MVEYFNRLAQERRPSLTFTGETRADWARWREAFSSRLRQLCGEWPQPVPLNVETISRIDEGPFVREKIVLDVDRHLSVPAYILVPRDRRRARNGGLPVILCLHGHGPFGKEPVAGIVDTTRPDLSSEISHKNYDYGAQMAREGFLTMAPDSRAMGELDDGGDPYPGRDPCNVHFLRGVLLGVYLLTLNIWDTMRCLDALIERPDVDGDRIGAMGLSWGGARTMFLAALDDRVKAADIICNLTRYEDFAIRDAEFCGSETLPHLMRYGDVADVAGLIAPRPLLIESGAHDTTYPVGPVLRSHEHLRRIYRAAGAEERLHIDLFPGGHQFHGPSARDFFDRYL